MDKRKGLQFILSLMLAALLVFGSAASVFAEDSDRFDLNVLRNNTYLTIDPDPDPEYDIAYVESTIPVADRAITHPYESDDNYSDAEFDFLIRDYSTDDPYPVWRLWITLITPDQFFNISSVTITIGDKDYTFSDLLYEDNLQRLDNGDYAQQMVIRLGADSLDFLAAMEEYSNTFDTVDKLMETTVPIVLHGTVDIQGTIGFGFLLEFMLFRTVFLESNAMSGLFKTNSTPMTVTDRVP